jgi:hypothetical protein
MEYASFLDSKKHVMASVRHFGRVVRRHDSFVVTRQRGVE